MLLKEKILESYPSIHYFCAFHDIKYNTLRKYISGARSIDNMSKYVLQQVCFALKCRPEDIGYTKKYWWIPPEIKK